MKSIPVISRMLLLAGVISGLVLSVSCQKKEGEDDEDSEPTYVGGNGGGGEEGEENALTQSVTSNIETVEQGMVPGSLALEALSLTENEDPCEGTNGLFDCQPNLLKLYLNMGKQMVTMSRMVIRQISRGISEIPVGSSGSIEINEDGMARIDYNRQEEMKYELLLHSDTGPFIHLAVNEGDYRIKFDPASAPDGDGKGKVSIHVNYTDRTHYSVDLQIVNSECDENDARAPQILVDRITRNGDVWQGKAMMYSPIWGYFDRDESGQDLINCDVTPDETTQVFFYTDFVGDDINTTAAFYMLPVTETTLDNMTSFEGADFCTNWSALCGGQDYMGQEGPISEIYQNNFCVTAADDSYVFGANCESESALISTPTYSAVSKWMTTGDIKGLSISLPSSL